MEDSKIIELLFDRDEHAIDELKTRFGRAVKHIAYSITGNTEDAEECENDTLLSVWRNIPPEKPEYLTAYVLSIARNISMAKFRYNTAKIRNAETVALDEELSEILPSADQNDTGIGDAINEFLKSEPKQNRMLFVRRYFYTDSLDELSSMTGIKKTHLAVKLMRIRKKLKKHLEKEGFTL